MSDTKSTNVENLPQPPMPTVNADGIKVYPTSFIPVKAPMEPSRIPTAKMSGLEIEIIHVIIFFALTIGLFLTVWKKPNER